MVTSRVLGQFLDELDEFGEVAAQVFAVPAEHPVGCKYSVRSASGLSPVVDYHPGCPLVLACAYSCLRFVVGLLVLRLDGDRNRQVDLLLLRHELSVLRRSVKKPTLNVAGRV